MPTTATRRSSKRPILAFAALALGLIALSVGPISCGTETNESTSGDAASERTGSKAGGPVLLNIGVADHTQQRPLSAQFLIETPRGDRWRPDPLEGGHVTRAFDKYPAGESQKLLLYPQGEEGPRLAVPFTMKADMSSLSAHSRTDIAVRDDSIVVTGPAVPDERIAFDRPSSPSSSPPGAS